MVSVDEVTGAYIRRPSAPLPADVMDGHRVFAERECVEMLRSFWVLIPAERWLNSPNALRSAAIKTRQLIAANRCGLRIPPTCISDDPMTISSVAAKWTRPLITKAIRSGFVRVGNEFRLAATTRLPETFPDDHADYAAIPATYQPEIPKAHDLRVTVVDQRVFTTAIFSQDIEATMTDWRVTTDGEDLRQEPVKRNPQ